jgi:hypothetical protein
VSWKKPMTYDALLKSLEGTSVALAIAESDALFPWIEAVHVLAITLVVGSIAIIDLRLIGFASRDHAVTSLSKDVSSRIRAARRRPWRACGSWS